MAIKVFCNDVPERSTRGRKVIEAAVCEGLKNRTDHADYSVSIFEDPEHFDVTVKIECVDGCWFRKFSPKSSVQELEPEFIQRAVEKIAFIKLKLM